MKWRNEEKRNWLQSSALYNVHGVQRVNDTCQFLSRQCSCSYTLLTTHSYVNSRGTNLFGSWHVTTKDLLVDEDDDEHIPFVNDFWVFYSNQVLCMQSPLQWYRPRVCHHDNRATNRLHASLISLGPSSCSPNPCRSTWPGAYVHLFRHENEIGKEEEEKMMKMRKVDILFISTPANRKVSTDWDSQLYIVASYRTAAAAAAAAVAVVDVVAPPSSPWMWPMLDVDVAVA